MFVVKTAGQPRVPGYTEFKWHGPFATRQDAEDWIENETIYGDVHGIHEAVIEEWTAK